MLDSRTPLIPAVPFQVRKALRTLGVKKVDWDLYADEKWFGYCEYGVLRQRIGLTVCIVTGKACIELLAPLLNEEVLL